MLRIKKKTLIIEGPAYSHNISCEICITSLSDAVPFSLNRYLYKWGSIKREDETILVTNQARNDKLLSKENCVFN